MIATWKNMVTTGTLFVAATLSGPEVSNAAGRLGERLATNRTNSAKDKPTSHETDEADRAGGGLLGKRTNSPSRLTTRGAKRKEVPPHAKESLNVAGELDIDLGDMVDPLDGPTLTPPSVPPTDDKALPTPSRTNSNLRPSPDPRVSRRPTALKRADAPKAEAATDGDRR